MKWKTYETCDKQYVLNVGSEIILSSFANMMFYNRKKIKKIYVYTFLFYFCE